MQKRDSPGQQVGDVNGDGSAGPSSTGNIPFLKLSGEETVCFALYCRRPTLYVLCALKYLGKNKFFKKSLITGVRKAWVQC